MSAWSSVVGASEQLNVVSGGVNFTVKGQEAEGCSGALQCGSGLGEGGWRISEGGWRGSEGGGGDCDGGPRVSYCSGSSTSPLVSLKKRRSSFRGTSRCRPCLQDQPRK